MNKLIMALALLLAPFFSFADGNIFDNGSVITKSPKVGNTKLGDCYVGYSAVNTNETCQELSATVKQSAFDNASAIRCNGDETSAIDCKIKTSYDDPYINVVMTYQGCTWSGDKCTYYDAEQSLGALHFWTFTKDVPNKECPPDGSPLYTFPIISGGEINACANPAQISLVDSCNASSGSEFLSIPVSSGSGCYPQSDGSSCKYDAVTSESGMEFYAMDLEGDCYSDNNLPDLSTGGAGGLAPEQIETPSNDNDTCKEWGGTGLVCPEKKPDVCDDNGTCPESCGTVNGVFVCIDNDMDNDDIPDYLDPDVDGDGIANGDDLDSNGDGKDDPIDNTGQGNGSGDGTSVEVDLGPVVSELKALNKTTKEMSDALNKTDVVKIKEPSKGLEGFYESVYEDGVEGMFSEKVDEFKQTEFYTFLGQFKPSFGGTPPNMGFCMNFGTYMNLGCFTLDIDPRIWPALKIFILVTAGFTCRKILFGG
jgi:hypothetical protein